MSKKTEEAPVVDQKSDDELWAEALEANGITEEQAVAVAAVTPTEHIEPDPEEEEPVSPVAPAAPVTPQPNNPYEGKTAAELIEMINNGTRKISEQGNQLHELRTTIQRIESQLQTTQTKAEKEAEDDILSQYRQEDIDAIRRIIREEKNAEKQQAEVQTEAQRKAAIDDNERFWSGFQASLLAVNPALAKQVEANVFEAIRKDPANTYHKAGWLASNFKAYVPQAGASGQTPQNPDNIIRKKVNAATAGGGSPLPTTANSLKGKPEPSDPDEYAQWLLVNQGIKI